MEGDVAGALGSVMSASSLSSSQRYSLSEDIELFCNLLLAGEESLAFARGFVSSVVSVAVVVAGLPLGGVVAGTTVGRCVVGTVGWLSSSSANSISTSAVALDGGEVNSSWLVGVACCSGGGVDGSWTDVKFPTDVNVAGGVVGRCPPPLPPPSLVCLYLLD